MMTPCKKTPLGLVGIKKHASATFSLICSAVLNTSKPTCLSRPPASLTASTMMLIKAIFAVSLAVLVLAAPPAQPRNEEHNVSGEPYLNELPPGISFIHLGQMIFLMSSQMFSQMSTYCKSVMVMLSLLCYY